MTSGARPGQLAIQTAWWQDALTSTGFTDAYPKMKLFMLFEQSKPEDTSDLRYFRLTVKPTVLSNFVKDLSSRSPLCSFLDRVKAHSCRVLFF